MNITLHKQPEGKNEHDFTWIDVEAEVTTLEDALDLYADFLRACGFHFDGYLTIEDE